MANNANYEVIDRLKRYFNEDDWLIKAKKKNLDFAEAIEGLKAEDIYYGDRPTLIRGYVWGNSTGSGESTYGDTTTKRTTSIDFNTDEYLFVADNNTATIPTCRAAARFVVDGFGSSDVVTKSEAHSIAEKEGKRVCRQALSDLDFNMSDCRLNRFGVQYTSDPVEVPIWPIFADINKSNGKSTSIHMGYYYTYENTNYIHLDIATPMTDKAKLILFGAIAAAATIAVIIISSLL